MSNKCGMELVSKQRLLTFRIRSASLPSTFKLASHNIPLNRLKRKPCFRTAPSQYHARTRRGLRASPRSRVRTVTTCALASSDDDAPKSEGRTQTDSESARGSGGDPMVLALAWMSKITDTDPTKQVSRLDRGLERLGLEKLDVLGVGSVGIVHSAVRRAAGGKGELKVAVKTLDKDASKVPVNRERFKKEMKLWSSLNHPNVVRVLHCSTRPLMLVMEYCNQNRLFSLLRSDPPEQVAGNTLQKIALDTAQGLLYLHERDIVHGDIKSANVLLHQSDPSGDVTAKLCDFGGAFRIKTIEEEESDDRLGTLDGVLNSLELSEEWSAGIKEAVGGFLPPQQSQRPPGTLLWMSPELLAADESTIDDVDPLACDVYAFGMVLYELVTRELPWDTSVECTRENVVRMVADEQWRPPLPRWTPTRMKSLINSCWAQNPTQRPAMSTVVRNLKATGSVWRTIAEQSLKEAARHGPPAAADEEEDDPEQTTEGPETALADRGTDPPAQPRDAEPESDPTSAGGASTRGGDVQVEGRVPEEVVAVGGQEEPERDEGKQLEEQEQEQEAGVGKKSRIAEGLRVLLRSAEAEAAGAELRAKAALAAARAAEEEAEMAAERVAEIQEAFAALQSRASKPRESGDAEQPAAADRAAGGEASRAGQSTGGGQAGRSVDGDGGLAARDLPGQGISLVQMVREQEEEKNADRQGGARAADGALQEEGEELEEEDPQPQEGKGKRSASRGRRGDPGVALLAAVLAAGESITGNGSARKRKDKRKD